MHAILPLLQATDFPVITRGPLETLQVNLGYRCNQACTALHRLNPLGYGKEGSGLLLNLVYNPQGPALPPSQAELERAYREHLGRFGIERIELIRRGML